MDKEIIGQNGKPETNISPLAREIKDGGMVFSSEKPQKGSVLLQTEQWGKFKPEIYAISSVIIDRIIENVISSKEKHPPFGLKKPTIIPRIERNVRSLDKNHPYEYLLSTMTYTLLKETFRELTRLDNNLYHKRTEPMVLAYERLTKIIPIRFLDCPYDLVNKYFLFDLFFKVGVVAATQIAIKTLRIIPEVCKEFNLNADSNMLSKIASNSYPMLARYAMLDEESFQLTGLYATKPDDFWFNPKQFVLVDSPSGLRLEFSDEVVNEVLTNKHNETTRKNINRTGCPAMVNFGDGSAMRKLWDWHVEIARTAIYPKIVQAT